MWSRSRSTTRVVTCAARAPRAGAAAGEPEWFVDRAEASGLDFVHVNGMNGRFYQPEISGSGAALFDYDNDGDLDAWLVQGGRLDARSAAPPAAVYIATTSRSVLTGRGRCGSPTSRRRAGSSRAAMARA